MSKYSFLLIIFLFTISTAETSAQSTIFNVPSTDVVPETRIYFEGDFIAHFGSYRNGGFQSYGYRTVYGLKRKIEVGANVFYTKVGKNNSPAELQPNFKYKVFEKEKNGLAVATGAQFFVPLNKNAGKRPFGIVYANVSKVFKFTRGTRITGGYYQTFATPKDFGTKQGVIAAIEQPIKGRLSFVADWYSGKNRLGYSAAGFNYAVTKRQFVMIGYNFGNSGRGNNAFSAFYGFTY